MDRVLADECKKRFTELAETVKTLVSEWEPGTFPATAIIFWAAPPCSVA
jgi:hypothetical protein